MLTQLSKLPIVVLLALGLCTACSDKAVDLGDDTPPALLGATLSDYAGEWEGYAEAYEWNDGSDVVKLALDANGNGVLEVGDSAPLPEPDAEQGYPPSDNPNDVGAVMGRIPALHPGFDYPIEAAVVESRRIRLGTLSQEIFREWCEGMEPVLDTVNTAEPTYTCVPNVGFGSDANGCFLGAESGQQATRIDCGKLACLHTCSCDADSCGIREIAAPDVRLDAALEADGEELVGTLLFDQRIVVRMTRTN